MPYAIPSRRPHCDLPPHRSERHRHTALERGYTRHWTLAKRAVLARLIAEHADPWCAYCGRNEAVTLDHALPPSRHHSVGSAAYDELFWNEDLWIPACLSCNSVKGQRLPHELPPWMLERLVAVLTARGVAWTGGRDG